MSAYALPGLFPPVEEACTCSGSTTSYATGQTSSTSSAAAGSFTSLASGKAISPLLPMPTSGTSDQAAAAASSSSTSSCSSNNTGSSCSTSPDYLDRAQQQSTKIKIGRKRNNHRSNIQHVSPTIHCSSSSSSSYAHLPPLKSLDDESDEPDGVDTSSSSSSGILGIAIKEAKIDPVRLVQYLTGGGGSGGGSSSSRKSSNINNNKTLRRRGSKERMAMNIGNGSGSSPQGSPVNRRAAVDFDSSSSSTNRAISSPHPTNHNANANNSPHNEAIEFELSITFQGRKYTAKRTMQCMIKLRDDLIREMNARRQWLARQMPPLHHDNDDDLAGSSVEDETTNNNDNSNIPSLHTHPTIEIPEIPPLNFSGDNDHHSHGSSSSQHHHHHCHSYMIGGMGFVGRGFTMLHAMVTSYVPVMDRWLKSVMAVVPQDSECLLNFLWEPPSNGDNLETSFGSIMESTTNNNKDNNNNNKSISMGSIKELDIEEEEDDI